MGRTATRTILLVSISLATGAALSAVASQEQEQDPTKLAPHIYEIVLENEHVRVLKVTARPGETPPVHCHPDRVLVSLNRCVDYASQETLYEAGGVSWEPAITHGGQTIASVNDCVFVEVELKSPTGR